MLLSLMRKHAKSWLIKFLIAIIAIVFIFYFGWSFTSDSSAKVAEVNGEIISKLEYEKEYRDLYLNFKNQYQNVWDDNLIKVLDLKNKALERLIEKKLISQEARKIGLNITENEIQEKIAEIPAFQTNGYFDERRYRALLSSNRMKPEDFEESFSQDLLQQKLDQFLMTFSDISDQDVLDYYQYANEKVKLSFVKFSPEDFKDSIEINQAPMNKFFENNKEEYRVPAKIKLTYITIDPDTFKEQVQIQEHEIISYYEENTDMFTQEKQVKIRHILFRIPPDSSPEDELAIKEKALSVLRKAREGEDFAKLAKEYSEGPAKEKGGDLGYLTRGSMTKEVKEFEDTAFDMEKGQISDLVKTSMGYHIIKVEDIRERKTKSLDEVRDQIVNILTRNESMDLANEKALSLIDQMPYDVDLAQYAEQHHVPVASTDYFSEYEPIPIIEGNEKLLDTLFSLEKNDVSELIELNNIFYIMQVSDKKNSYLPELEEVFTQVREDYIQHMALLSAKLRAEEYLEALKGGRDWDELAKERNLKTDTTNFFTRLAFPDKIGAAPGIQEAAFKLSDNNRYPDKVFENDEGAFVIRWEEKQEIDKSKYQNDKKRYADGLMRQRQQAIFRSWVERLKKNAEIDRSEFQRKYR
jgi:peptidyl-prolyl cis-trans isomerase D